MCTNEHTSAHAKTIINALQINGLREDFEFTWIFELSWASELIAKLGRYLSFGEYSGVSAFSSLPNRSLISVLLI